MRKLFLGAAIATCSIVIGLHAPDLAAQEAGGSVDVERIQPTRVGGGQQGGGQRQQVYAAKFLCGQIGTDDDDFLVPGTYLTAINIANLGTAANLQVQVLESLRTDEGTGAVATLDPAPQVERGRALEIDCSDIFNALFGGTDGGTADDFFKGFVLITPARRASLEVVAVYSYSGGTEGIDFGAGGGADGGGADGGGAGGGGTP